MPRHGFGLGFRSQLAEHYWHKTSALDWIEVITENFMHIGGLPRKNLERLADLYPIALHGVGLSIGAEQDIDPNYLKSWAKLIGEFTPIHVTDHLCWTSHRKHYSHDLLPICYESKTLARICERMDFLQNLIGRKILLENPSAYVHSAHATMTEPEFMAELVRRTGCGVLLDVNNLVVNFYNLGQDPLSYVEILPSDSVEQIHLAGHTINPEVRVDTHDQPMLQETWELYAIAQARFPEADPLLEWDANWPEFANLLQELQTARGITQDQSLVAAGINAWKQRIQQAGQAIVPLHKQGQKASHTQQQAYHSDFWTAIVGSRKQVYEIADSGHFSSALPTAKQDGLFVYHTGYSFRGEDALADTFPTLKHVMDDESFRRLATSYIKRHPHSHFSMNDIGRHLSAYLVENPDQLDFEDTPSALYADIALLDWSRHEIALRPNESCLSFTDLQSLSEDAWEHLHLTFANSYIIASLQFDVLPTFAAVAKQEPASKPNVLAHHFHCYRLGTQVFHDTCDALVVTMHREFTACKGFGEVVTSLQKAYDLEEETAISRLAAQVGWWMHHGCVAGMRIDAKHDHNPLI